MGGRASACQMCLKAYRFATPSARGSRRDVARQPKGGVDEGCIGSDERRSHLSTFSPFPAVQIGCGAARWTENESRGQFSARLRRVLISAREVPLRREGLGG